MSQPNVQDVLSDAGFDFIEEGASPNVIEGVLRTLDELLKDEDDLRRVMVREVAIKRLKEIGVQSAARLVDAALVRPGSGKESVQGQAILFQEVEPWPEEVDGAELLRELAALFRRFIVLPEAGDTALALWTLHTYAIDAMDISPFLALQSPEKRCGKTLTLEVLSLLVNKPLPFSNITPSAVFRTVEKFRPALLVDEMDALLTSGGDDGLRGILDSGHRRSLAFVVRLVGDDYEPRTFSTWCPKALALIGTLPGTLEDRAIIIHMRRKAPGDRVEKFRRGLIVLQAETIRRKARRWIDDNLAALRAADPALPDGLNDRAADSWEPLLAIADAAGGEWSERACEAARVLAGTVSEGENSAAIQLLMDIRSLFTLKGADRLSSENLIDELAKMEDRPWPEWKHAKPLTKTQLARLLSRFGIRPKQLWIDSSKGRGYALNDFEDAFSRYIPSIETVGPVGPNNDAGLRPFEEAVGEEFPTVSKKGANGCKQRLLPVLPDRKGVSEGEEWKDPFAGLAPHRVTVRDGRIVVVGAEEEGFEL